MCVETPSCPCNVPRAHTEGWKGQNPLRPASPPIEASRSAGTAPWAAQRHSPRGTAALAALGMCHKTQRKTHILHPWPASPGEGGSPSPDVTCRGTRGL